MKVQKEVDKPMQLMALKAARQDMEKRDKQRKKEERLEEERIRADTGLDPWVDHEAGIQEEIKHYQEVIRNMLECTTRLKELFSEPDQFKKQPVTKAGTKEKNY